MIVSCFKVFILVLAISACKCYLSSTLRIASPIDPLFSPSIIIAVLISFMGIICQNISKKNSLL